MKTPRFNSRIQESESLDDYSYYKSPSLNVNISYDLLTRIIERAYGPEPQSQHIQHSDANANSELLISNDLLERLVEESAHEKFEQMMTKSRIIRELPLKTKEAYTSHQLHTETDELLEQDWYKKPALYMRDNSISACSEERTNLFNCIKDHKNTRLVCRNLVESFDRCARKYITNTHSDHL